MLLGIPGDATYAKTMPEANRAFYRLTVLALAQNGAGWRRMAGWHSGLTGDVVILQPDLTRCRRLAAEREAQWRRVAECRFPDRRGGEAPDCWAAGGGGRIE